MKDSTPTKVELLQHIAELQEMLAQQFEQLLALARDGGFATGHADSFTDLMAEIKWQLMELLSIHGLLSQKHQLLCKNFDELATVIGWTRERCDQTGDSPYDVAVELVKARF